MGQDNNRVRKSGDLRKLIGVLLGIGAASSAAAQTAITIDSSFGRTPGQLGPSATNTTVTGNRGATYNVNNLYTLAESQGRTAGANLFHSFGTFNIGTGDAAVFTTTTPTLQNIIARVSGPSASTIQGLLAVNAAAGSNPNLFLINPAGVTFGAGAVVDVPAAFHVSTANELRFADGSTFQAGIGPDSSMTMAAPEAFGFVGGNANIAFNGIHADGQQGRAAFTAGSFDVTAGGITFDGSMIAAPGAQIRLLGNGAMANSIPIEGEPSLAAQGDLRLTASRISTTVGKGAAGDILLFGRDVVIEDTSIDASLVVLTDGTDVFQSGSAGTVRIRAAGDVELRGTTGLQATVFGFFVSDARGGTVEIDARGDITSDKNNNPDEFGPGLRVSSSTPALVTPGDGIILRGRSLNLRSSSLLSNTQRGGQSAAGDIRIEVTDNVQIIDSFLSSNGSSSAAGDINIRANAIELSGRSSISSNLISQNDSTLGGVGSITLDAASQVIVGPDAFIQAATGGLFFANPENAPPGQIRINTPRLQLAGLISAETGGNVDASNIIIDGGNAGLIVQGVGLVTSSTGSQGDAGSITLLGRDVTVEGVRLQSASEVSTSGDNPATGAAGSIQITADNQLSLTGTQLQTDTATPGKAGNITLAARTGVIDTSQIQSQASAGSTGQAGTVTVRASESLALTNSTLSVANDALAPDPTTVAQGLITVNAPTLTIKSSLITAESSLNVPASAIAVNADSRLTLEQATVSSTARGTAAAGDISISSNGIVALTDSAITGEAVAANTSQLTVTGTEVLLDGASRLSTRLLGDPATTDPITTTGGVGAIRVTGTNRIAVGAASSIDASAVGSFANPEQATPGEVRLTTPKLDVAGTITTATLGNVAASNIVVESGAALNVTGSGVVTSSTSGRGNAGSIDIGANDIALAGTTVTSATTSDGSAGTVTLRAANRLDVTNATVRTDTGGAGKAGNVTLSGRTITIDPTLISSQAASGSSGQTGTIDVTATQTIELRNSTLSIANDAMVVDPTLITQGRITVDAPTLTLRNSAITAESSQNVIASAITVNAMSGATLDTSSISSSARGTAAAGDIAINSQGIVALTDSSITGEAQAASTSQLTVTGSEVLLGGASRLSTQLVGGPTTTTGGVGAIRIAGTNKIAVGANASIDARAVGSFDNPTQAAPGEVRLTTPRLDVAGTITTATLGNVAASNIVVESPTGLTIAGAGVLTSSTSGAGNAGSIDIGGNDVALAGTTVTSATTSDGSAGTVTLRSANRLDVTNATVRTDTAGAGKAGNVSLSGSTITIDPTLISSQAADGSAGQTGTIDVVATKAIEVRDSTLSIANAGRVDDPSMTPLGRIRLAAPDVKLLNSNVTAQSSANVAASAISINAPNGLVVRNSNVTTSAQDGNGGNIDVLAQRLLLLDRSQISTSVLGNQTGSGGNITVRTNVGVINTGFIQANTAALGASGGNVVIDVGQLLAVGRVIAGGTLPLSFDPEIGLNAIQAAAPDGVSGAIQLTGPALDIVGTLPRVEAEFVATAPLGQDLCKVGGGSSLTQLGRGGLRPLSTGLLRPDTSLRLLPELPALSLRLTPELPSSGKCGH